MATGETTGLDVAERVAECVLVAGIVLAPNVQIKSWCGIAFGAVTLLDSVAKARLGLTKVRIVSCLLSAAIIVIGTVVLSRG